MLKRIEGWWEICRLWQFLDWIPPVIWAGRPYRLWRLCELLLTVLVLWGMPNKTVGFVFLQLHVSGILKMPVMLMKIWVCSSLGIYSNIRALSFLLLLQVPFQLPPLLQGFYWECSKQPWKMAQGIRASHAWLFFSFLHIKLFTKMLHSVKNREPFPHQ